MPWYWTDDLARSLIDTGKVDRTVLNGWIISPVAVRGAADSADSVAESLLAEDEEAPPKPMGLAA